MDKLGDKIKAALPASDLLGWGVFAASVLVVMIAVNKTGIAKKVGA